MGLIFWIDENTFATSLVEKALKGQGLDFYTVAHARDFAYLINDFRPSFVVIDTSTAFKDLEALRQQYVDTDSFHGAQVVFIGQNEAFSFITSECLQLERPFDPFKLKDFFRKN